MNYTQVLDYLKTGDTEAVRTREMLRSLYSIVNEQYPKQFKKSISGICFAEIDDVPMGDRLIIKENKFLGKPVVEVDITHHLSSYDRNQIMVRQDRPDLIVSIEQFLTDQNIPYRLRRETR